MIIVLISAYLISLTQVVNENPGMIIMNSLSKQGLLDNYSINGLFITSINYNDYKYVNNIQVTVDSNKTTESYLFNVTQLGIITKVIFSNHSSAYCEGEICIEGNLSKQMTQRIAGISLLTKLELLGSKKLTYEGFKIVNGRVCDIISAQIDSNEVIDYIIDGETTNLKVNYCIDRFLGLPLISEINALTSTGSVKIIFESISIKANV